MPCWQGRGPEEAPGSGQGSLGPGRGRRGRCGKKRCCANSVPAGLPGDAQAWRWHTAQPQHLAESQEMAACCPWSVTHLTVGPKACPRELPGPQLRREGPQEQGEGRQGPGLGFSILPASWARHLGSSGTFTEASTQ